jgi:hypothetical protein
MRAPSGKRSTDKRIDDEAALEEARRRLRPLFVNVFSWSETDADTSSPKKEFRAAIGAVECALDGAEGALNEVRKSLYLIEANEDAIADAISFIKFARKAAIPKLRQARPPKGRWGRHADLNASRNQTIAETVESIGKQYGVSQEQASSIVSEALKNLVHEHRRVFRALTKDRADPAWIPADPAWIDECLESVDKLSLSEDSIESIAKKCRTVPK